MWNDNYNPKAAGITGGKRTPLNTAISKDEGRTWLHKKTLEDNPKGTYCYTAIEFVNEDVLLAYCAGIRPQTTGLGVTQITRFPVRWLYTEDR